MHTALTRARTVLVAPHLDESLVDHRLTLAERLSLRLGLWLLLRSTRRLADDAPVADRASLATAREALIAREQRERAWRHAAHLNGPFV